MSVLLLAVFITVLTFLLLFLSVLELAVARLSPLAFRVLSEKTGNRRCRLLEELVSDRNSFLLPIRYCSQLAQASILALTIALCFKAGLVYSLICGLAVSVVLVTVFGQLIPAVSIRGRSQRILLRVLPSFGVWHRILGWLSFPVTALAARSERAVSVRRLKEGPEEAATLAEIQAYLDVGEEAGIFETTHSRLIQSALEFGRTSVREIMTPRSEIVAIEREAAMSRLREIILESKHSRIPVYGGNLDKVEGYVHARSLLARWDGNDSDEAIPPMVKDVLVVPETKNVSQLLGELQQRAEQMAIVVNEYGTVSGLVTVEDLLEEIVGEIHDESDCRSVDIIYEGAGHYLVKGSVEVGDLEEVLGVEYGDHEATTISGLIVDYLSKVPAVGETILIADTEFEVLSSDQKRIRRLRVAVSRAADQNS